MSLQCPCGYTYSVTWPFIEHMASLKHQWSMAVIHQLFVKFKGGSILYNASGDSTFERSSRRLSLLCHSTGMYKKKRICHLQQQVSLSSHTQNADSYSIVFGIHIYWHMSRPQQALTSWAIAAAVFSVQSEALIRSAGYYSPRAAVHAPCLFSHSALTNAVVQPRAKVWAIIKSSILIASSAFLQNLALAAALLGLLHCRLHSLQWVLCPCMRCSM